MLRGQRLEPTANDVMLGRIFVNEERQQLKEDMRLAAEDPGQFSELVGSIQTCPVCCKTVHKLSPVPRPLSQC